MPLFSLRVLPRRSCEEDRHLAAADVPVDTPPDVLIVESTYGMQVRRLI
jgi:Cft2 family RNA processing exonuclease